MCRFCGTRNRNGQNTIAEGRLDLVLIDLRRQADATLEAAIAAFGIAAFLVAGFGLLFAPDHQLVIVQADFDVLFLHAR